MRNSSFDNAGELVAVGLRLGAIIAEPGKIEKGYCMLELVPNPPRIVREFNVKDDKSVR